MRIQKDSKRLFWKENTEITKRLPAVSAKPVSAKNRFSESLFDESHFGEKT
jgi:hypothetical protein